LVSSKNNHCRKHLKDAHFMSVHRPREIDWLDCWDEFVQKAHFIKLACLCHSKQNDLTYLG